MKRTEDPIIVEQLFNSTANEVWQAITELKFMKQWYFDNIEAFIPEVGFETDFIVRSEDRIFPHFWKITEVIPYKKISYDWEFDGYEGKSNVSFDIIEDDHGSLLRVTNTVIEDFNDDISEFRAESCRGGWNYFINDRLKTYLENK